MVEILQNEGNFVAVKLSGKLQDADYQQFIAVLSEAAEKGMLHLLIQIENFQGWDSHTLWEGLELDARFRDKIERLAFVGDRAWEAWMAKLAQPFTRAWIEYYQSDDAKNAWAWIQDGL